MLFICVYQDETHIPSPQPNRYSIYREHTVYICVVSLGAMRFRMPPLLMACSYVIRYSHLVGAAGSRDDSILHTAGD